MTVSSTLNRKSYAGDGVTTSFSTSPVVFFDSSDLDVYAVVTATGVSTTLTENTHYTVTGGSGSTGSINTAGGASPYGAPAAGYTLLIVRSLPLTQEVDLQNNDSSDAAVQEEAFDRGVMISQQLETKVERSIHLADSDVSGLALELPVVTADGFLKANAAGTAFEYVGVANVATSALVLPVPITQGGTGAITAALARTALGALGTGAVTTVGLTMATNKILGRGTASTGAVEELTPTDLTVTASAVALSTTGVTSASYTSPVVTVDTKGRVTAISSGSVVATAQASTSGTSKDFTGIPSTAKRIRISLQGVSTNGTANVQVQLGVSGTPETSGYSGGVSLVNSTGTTTTFSAGFILDLSASAAVTRDGAIDLCLFDSSANKWSAHGSVCNSAGNLYTFAGTKALAGVLDMVRITVDGVDTFDAGNIGVTYES